MRFNSRRGNSRGVVFILLFFILLAMGGFYLYNSTLFEKTPPVVEIKKQIISNLKRPIFVSVKDNIGLKKVRILLTDGQRILGKETREFPIGTKEKIIKINFPAFRITPHNKKLLLVIEATDTSKWNYFKGNKTLTKTKITVDKQKPELYPILSSYGITKGGSAVVIFKAKDDNIKNIYITTNFDKKFIPTPFYKNGYYISLLAWPVREKRFSASLVAIDKAGNKSRYNLDLFRKNKNYRVSKIKLKESFINGKITDLAEEISKETASLPPSERFRYINETLRKENEKKIEEATLPTDKEMIKDFKISVFYPLKNAAAVASFGDHRFYFYKEKQISTSYHLGLDLASTAGADIISSNDAKVVFSEYNGIYGNNLILRHSLGLYSLYGHCSVINVSKEDEVKKGDIVAQTGKSGLALGDHLHFGILIQGIEVRPDEWIDKRWIKTNIDDIIEKAKKIIDKRE